MKASLIHKWHRFPPRDFEISRAINAPLVREHPSKPQGRVGSPQRTIDSGAEHRSGFAREYKKMNANHRKQEAKESEVFRFQFSAFRFQNLCTLRNLRMIFLCSIRGDSRHSRASNPLLSAWLKT
jgi:hypothetical protein